MVVPIEAAAGRSGRGSDCRLVEDDVWRGRWRGCRSGCPMIRGGRGQGGSDRRWVACRGDGTNRQQMTEARERGRVVHEEDEHGKIVGALLLSGHLVYKSPSSRPATLMI